MAKNQGPKGQSSHMPKTGTRSHQKFITALVCTICTHLKSFNLVHSGTHTHTGSATWPDWDDSGRMSVVPPPLKAATNRDDDDRTLFREAVGKVK